MAKKITFALAAVDVKKKTAKEYEEEQKKAAAAAILAGATKSALAAGLEAKKQKAAERAASLSSATPAQKTSTAAPVATVPTRAQATSNARYGVEEYNNAYHTMLDQMLKYAKYGPSAVKDLANSLQSDEMIDMSERGFRNWNDDTAAAALLGQGELAEYFRENGYFDTSDYLKREYITMPSTGYLKQQMPGVQKAVEESLAKDEQNKLYQSNLESTMRGWEQLEAEKNNPHTFDPMYGYAMMEYLQGDREEPFNYDQWDYEYQLLDDAKKKERLADLEKQWNSLDFDTLTGRNYKYESKTNEYQNQLDTIEKELERRSQYVAISSELRNSPYYGVPYVVPEEDKARAIMPGLGGELMLTQIDTNSYNLQYLINHGMDTNLGSQIENGNPVVKNYLDNGLFLMEEDEKYEYNAAVALGREKEYLEIKLPELRYRKARYDAQYLGAMATDPVVGPIMSVATVPMNIWGAGMTAIGAATGEDDPYAPIYSTSRTVNTYRGKRGEVWGEMLPFEILGEEAGNLLYNIGMSTADMVAAQKFSSAMAGIFGKADAAKSIMGTVMATEVGTGTFLDDLEAGRGYEYAVLHGFTDSMISTVAESGFLDNLFSQDGKLAMRTLKSAVSEGSEEIFEEGGQMMSDAFFSYLTGQESQIKEIYNYYVDTLGKDQAAIATLKDLGNRFAIAGLSGFAMGGGTAAVYNAGQYADNRKAGKTIRNTGDPEAIMNIALGMDESSESNKIAKDVQAHVDKGKPITNYELGQLTGALARDLDAERASIVDRVQDDAIVNRLVELEVNTSDAKKLAPVIRKLYRGGKLTMAEKTAVPWNDQATQVVKELSRETKADDGQRAGNKWVSSMKATQIEATGEVTGKQIDLISSTTTKNVSKVAQDAAAKGEAKVRKGKNGKAAGKPTARKVAFDDGTARGEGDLLRFEEQDGELKMVIQTETKEDEGKTQKDEQAVSLDSLTEADGAGTAGIIEAVNEINKNLHPVTAEEANTLLGAYGASGGDVARFVDNYERAYLSGYSGTETQQVLLDPQLLKMARESGARQAEKDEAVRKQRASDYKALVNQVAAWLGKVKDNSQVQGTGDTETLAGALEGMTETQRTTAEVCINLGKATGLNVVLFESDADSVSQIQNGSFDAATHTVYLDINSGAASAQDIEAQRSSGTLGAAMVRTMSHELTHYLEVASPEMYAKYKAAVRAGLKAAGKNADLAVLIREKIDRALNEGRKLTYGAAEAEVIADASEYMLQDSKFTNNLDSSLKGKIKAFVQNFAQKVKDAFAQLTGGHRESMALRELADGVYHYTKNLQELWDASLQEILDRGTTDLSVDTTEMVEDEETNEREKRYREQGVKYSTRDEIIDYADASSDDFHKDGRIYDYDFMVRQKPAKVVVIPSVDNLMKNGRFSRSEVVESGKAGIVGPANEKGHKVVENVYTGRALTITNNSIRHGLNGNKQRLLANAQIGMVIGDVVKNGIPVNGLIPTDENAMQTYAMVTPCVTEDGKRMMAVTHVDIQKNEVSSVTFTDIVHSANGRIYKNSEPVSDTIDVEGESPYHPSRYTISISDLLRDVNISFKSLLSEDVLEHLGEERPQNGAYSDKVLYSTRDYADQTETPEFTRWFGDSKVVNEDGTPKVMYHGTAEEFWVFEKRKANDALGRRMGLGAGKGKYYLSEYEGVGRAAANSAATMGRGYAPRVMELYVSAKKVMDRAEYDRRLETAYEKYPNSRPGSVAYDYKARDKAIAEVDKAIRKEGYDGVWDRDSGEMFVYEPTQIKSATDNVGTFAPENPDIRYSTRDLPADITVRDYLREMKPTSRMNETEKYLLKKYQEQLKILEEKDKLVEEQEEIIRTAPMRNPDGSLNDEITKAKNRSKIYRDQANRAARALTAYERDDGFANILATGRQVANKLQMGSAGGIADAADALEKEVAELTAMLTKAEADVTRTASGQKTAFARGLYNPDELKAAAQKLKDEYGSRMSVKTIADRLALTYGELYANNGAEGAKLFSAAAKDLAVDLLQGNKFRYKSEILPMLREKIGTISLSETDVQEIENRGYTLREYKAMLSPYIKVTEGGSDLSSYATNAQYYGEGALAAILNDDTEGNLAMRLYEVISQEKAKEMEIAYEGMTESQLIGMAMADIAGANLPMSANNQTVDYLRKELMKYAGENENVAIAVEEAIGKAKVTTAKASKVWREAVKHTETARAAVEYYRALEERRRVMELAEQKKTLTEQLKTDAAKKIKEQVDKKRAEYQERQQRAREYRKTRDEVDKLRRGIGRKVKRLNTLRVRETDQKHVPQELQHVADAVMRAFTDSELSRLAFSAEKTAHLRRTYSILATMEHDMSYYWDDELEQDIDNLISLSENYNALKNREGNVPSRYSLEGVELETEILQGVDNIVSNVLNMIDSANKIFLTERDETYEKFAFQTGEKLRTRDDFKVRKGWKGRVQTMLDETIRTGNVTPIYFFEHLENQEIQDVFNEIREGMHQAAMIEREGKEYIERVRANRNYGKWVADGRLTMKTSNGHTIELTREEAAEIYAIAKREKANKLYQTEHLLYGGFQYKHIDDHVDTDRKHLVKDTPHQLDAADLAKIENWLTDEQKAYADDLVEYLSTTMADYGNEASMEMYGYNKFTEQYYIPFHTVASQRFQRGDEGPQGENAGTGRVKNSGFTKKLQYKANQPLYVGGISETVADHIHKMAAYSAMVQPIENMKRLLNYKVLENDGTSNTIRALIGQKYGKASEDYLTQLLKDLNGATQSDQRAAGFTDKLVSAFKRGAVMASASVVLQQPTAMARAMAYISPKYFAQNPFYRPSKGTWEKMMKYSGTAVIKDMGKFDVGMGKTASQYILDEELNAVEAYRRLKAESKTKAGKAAYDRFMAWLTAAPGAADQWTWGLIWKAAEAEQAALHPEMDHNSEAFLQIVGQRFDDVVDHTQVYDSVLTKSNLMRSTNAMHKMATSFMSEPTLSLNMLYDALTGWKSKRHTGWHRGRIIGSVVASQVLAGAMAALVQAWNDDDDERNWLEKYTDRATGNIIDNIFVPNMIPYVKDIVSLFQGYDVERMDTAVISDAITYTIKFMGKIADEKELTIKDWENFAGTWANITGIPAKNIFREVRRTINAVKNTDWSEPNGFNVGQAMLENTWGYSDKNKAYYQRIVTAEMRGDTEWAEDLRNYMMTSKMVTEDSMTEGVRSAYKERYEEGGIEKDDAISFLLDHGLVTGDDEEERKKNAFQYVDRWEEGSTNYSAYNTLKAAYGAINYNDIRKAWKELTDNGYTDKQVKEQSRQLLKKLVQEGKINTYQATELLRKWCSYAKDSDNVEKPKEWQKNK